MKITLSELDEMRFGVITAKMNFECDDNLNEVIDWCMEKNTKFLIVRISTEHINLVQEMERNDFMLTDTLVYFRNKKIEKTLINLPDGYSWRLANLNDADEVEILATQTFVGYKGHYHADQNLAKKDCDLVYSSWAANSCKNKILADAVILILKGQEIAAFATLKKVEDYMCEGVLFGVAPNHQGKNLYSSLMDLAQQWALNNSFCQMSVSTQITNLAVQKVWCRQGFEPHKSFYTLHKWFSQ
jgi:hypothetical protein